MNIRKICNYLVSMSLIVFCLSGCETTENKNAITVTSVYNGEIKQTYKN